MDDALTVEFELEICGPQGRSRHATRMEPQLVAARRPRRRRRSGRRFSIARLTIGYLKRVNGRLNSSRSNGPCQSRRKTPTDHNAPFLNKRLVNKRLKNPSGDVPELWLGLAHELARRHIVG